MAKYPGLMLWTDAWIADTHHLTVELRGAYMDLLVLMWRTPGCRVPNDDHWLAHHLGYTADQVTNLVRPIITEFGTLVAGSDYVTQKRLQREFAVAHKRKEKAVEAIRTRWNSRNQKPPSAVSNGKGTKKTDSLVIHSSPSPSPAPAHSTVQEQVQVRKGPRSLASPRSEGALAREARAARPVTNPRDPGVDYRSPPRSKSDAPLQPLPEKLR